MRRGVLCNIMLLVLIGALNACASISEDECRVGAWSDLGYRDGVNGRNKGKLADYAETCAKYSVAPDRQAYLAAYDLGLAEYCTYQQGFELGESGSSFNQACSGHLQDGFDRGYDDGRVRYEIHQEHDQMIGAYEEVLEELVDVRARLAGDVADQDEDGDDIALSANERKRLLRRQYRLEGELDDLRQDIRDFETGQGLPRHHF